PGRQLVGDDRVLDEPRVVGLTPPEPPGRGQPASVAWWVTYQRVAWALTVAVAVAVADLPCPVPRSRAGHGRNGHRHRHGHGNYALNAYASGWPPSGPGPTQPRRRSSPKNRSTEESYRGKRTE